MAGKTNDCRRTKRHNVREGTEPVINNERRRKRNDPTIGSRTIISHCDSQSVLLQDQRRLGNRDREMIYEPESNVQAIRAESSSDCRNSSSRHSRSKHEDMRGG